MFLMFLYVFCDISGLVVSRFVGWLRGVVGWFVGLEICCKAVKPG